jgi:transposase-like protein
MKYTVKEFRQQFPDDKACLAYIFILRCPKGTKCAKCGHGDPFYPIEGRREYVCCRCGSHFSPTAGTIFHKSPTPLTLWFHAIFMFATAKNGVSAMELMRQLGVTYKCAWRMARQLRLLMSQDGDLLAGVLEADESYVGGKRHGKRGLGADGKTPVFGVVERGGRIRTQALKKARSAIILPLLLSMAKAGSMLSTDESGLYNKAEAMGFMHETVKHGGGEFVRGAIHTQTIDGFWSQFKRSVNGTYHAISSKHMQTYLDEFCFRYSHRGDVASIPETMFGMAGKVL